MNVGELFVSLGFDVDDSKLKSFDESLKGVLKTGLEIAGIGGGIAGFTALAKGASDTALIIDNLTQKFGLSTKAIQDFASATHQFNPLVSRDQGIAQLGHFADYLNSAATKGTGAGALNRLGVQFSPADIQHPEVIIDKLLQVVPELLAKNPNNRGLYADQLAQLFGDPNAINTFSKGKGAYSAAAAAGFVSEEDLARQVKARDNIAELQNQWDAFVSHATGSLAEGVIKLEGFIKNPLPQDAAHPTLAGIGRLTDWLGGVDPFNLGGILGTANSAGQAIGGTAKQSVITGDRASQARRYFISQGWSPAQANGMVARLLKEDGTLDPGAVNPTSGAYGIAQWLSKDRVANFEKHAHRPLVGSSFEQQLDFIHYELTKGMERAAGNAIRSTTTDKDAELAMRNKYERPDPPVTVNLTQNIHSNGDPEQVAYHVNAGIRTAVQNTYLQQIGATP